MAYQWLRQLNMALIYHGALDYCAITHYVKCWSPWKLLSSVERPCVCSSHAQQGTILPLCFLVVVPQVQKGRPRVWSSNRLSSQEMTHPGNSDFGER